MGSRRRLCLIGALVIAVPAADSVIALATNAAASTRFPGILGYIKTHP